MIKVMWGLAVFGLLLGLLAALNTTAGLTATLIGLLFTFTGSSMLGWYKLDAIKPEDRPGILYGIGLLSSGMVAGLFMGFLLRLFDEGYVQPWLAERGKTPVMKLRDEFKEIRDLLERNKGKPPDEDWKKIVASLEAIAKEVDVQVAKNRDQEKRQPVPIFRVQGDKEKKAALEAVRQELAIDANRAVDDKAKLSTPEREDLQSLAAALERSEPSRHLAPNVAESVKKMVDSGRLSEPTSGVLQPLLK